MENKNKIDLNSVEKEDFNGSIFIPIIGIAFLVLGLIITICHPKIGYPIYIDFIYGFALIFLGISMFVLFISDLWFIGKKLDSKYRSMVLSVYKNDSERIKHPVPHFMAGLRPYRTLMYTRAIIMPRLSKKKSIFKESLKEEVSLLDIFFAWMIYFFIIFGFVLLVIGAILS